MFCLLNIVAILVSGIVGGIITYSSSGNLPKAIGLGTCFSMLSIFILFLSWFCLAAIITDIFPNLGSPKSNRCGEKKA